uniref:Apple domain-containing protein n=1 Tax=Romanomermis culicivorax TaxID=13658 RepID=A0A915HMV4_ROMCU
MMRNFAFTIIAISFLAVGAQYGGFPQQRWDIRVGCSLAGVAPTKSLQVNSSARCRQSCANAINYGFCCRSAVYNSFSSTCCLYSESDLLIFWRFIENSIHLKFGDEF